MVSTPRNRAFLRFSADIFESLDEDCEVTQGVIGDTSMPVRLSMCMGGFVGVLYKGKGRRHYVVRGQRLL